MPKLEETQALETQELERQFDAAMLEIYDRAANELRYRATRYLQMLRRHGGLETARRLLRAPMTSDGYDRLRSEGRLDLTVEALALREEFRPLFTDNELERARVRLAYYEDVAAAERHSAEPADPQLLELLTQVAKAEPSQRVSFRDRVAGYGLPAIRPVEDWVAAGNSPGFALIVMEAIGRQGNRPAARDALRRLRGSNPNWATTIDEAVARLDAEQVASHRPTPARPTDEYVATGAPPPSLGPCGVQNKDGTACLNPGRHDLGEVLACTTHYKAAIRK